MSTITVALAGSKLSAIAPGPTRSVPSTPPGKVMRSWVSGEAGALVERRHVDVDVVDGRRQRAQGEIEPDPVGDAASSRW
ncbi:MAG: hypothetical protein R2939_10810 [Kofleriaceae bacterium]